MGNLVQDNEKDWILEAINHLKHRKARPDLSRISLRMKRKYQINFAQTKKLLESLIESGIVVKAVYKNNTSYRDVSKWKKGKLGGQIQNSNKMLKRFVRAIEAKETVKGTGVTCEEIEDFLGTQVAEKCFLSGAALREALEKEVSTGYLKKIFSGIAPKYLVNDKNESLIMILEETDVNDDKNHLDLDLDLDDIQVASKAASETDKALLNEKILKAVQDLDFEDVNQQAGFSLFQIRRYLVEKHHLNKDESCLEELLESLVHKNVLKKKGDRYTFPKKISLTASVESSSTNDMVTTQDSSVDNFADQQVKILQGLSLIPKAAKEGMCKPATLSFFPHLSQALSEDRKNFLSSRPSRPPSKRRRILKDHGPDFEIEMPTKTKGKVQGCAADTKDSVYPTPSSSPISERSESTLVQSFQNPVTKKKRGRPKKLKEETAAPREMSFDDDLSQQATPSESSLTFPANNDLDDDSLSSGPSVQEICHWTSQQVAEFFKAKGYIEEAQSMLNHEMDGAALGLLKRSDIVGPPLGGILQIKKLGRALKLFRDIRDLLYQGHSSNYVDPYEEKSFFRS
ncbi:histone acetyltransferase kat6b-like [Plakobranchus ocellatus]|uniref:Histone acetyltransferase kat6b-like n=1 Tax=Plakobranchus ocellatus TaxID=259542 RepID=A0AAV4BK36_9GAST|nr:histone acetyltransferase kat6b-like [Plakobranchus ocellatus]